MDFSFYPLLRVEVIFAFSASHHGEWKASEDLAGCWLVVGGGGRRLTAHLGISPAWAAARPAKAAATRMADFILDVRLIWIAIGLQ